MGSRFVGAKEVDMGIGNAARRVPLISGPSFLGGGTVTSYVVSLMWMRAGGFLGGAIALAACASTGPTAGRGSASDACWPIVPLEVQALEHGREWEPVSWLGADGTISNRRGPIGRIAGDTLTIGAGQAIALSGKCTGRRATLGSPLNPALKMVVSYDESDAFEEMEGRGARITVAADGAVEMRIRAGQPMFGRPGSGGGAVRVVGDVHGARRTAALLVFTTVAIGAAR